jgi:hypothetical protein
MMIMKISLPRRTFLRGMGTALALPLLDAMVPALTALANTPARPVKRLGVVYVPNGIMIQQWTPSTTGSDFELSPILQSLAPFRDRLVVVSGLNGAGGAVHTGAATEFLTGVKVNSGTTAGTSIDQIVASEFGKETQLASLELALDSRDGTGSCDGQSCALSNSISWRTPTLLLPMENDPRLVFERLFGDGGTTDPAVRVSRLRKDRSILDSVTETVVDLQRGLGAGDRHKIVEYLESVRDIERRIQRAEEQSSRELPLVSQPAGVPQTTEEHAKLMFDLQLLAYQCDLTRVTTFMVGREFSGRTYPEIGIPEAHHPLSHHQSDREKMATCARLNAYHVDLLAYYLEKLRSTPDGDGSLLDHLLLLYGAGMSDGNSHDHTNLPLLLVGGPSLIKGGRHLKYDGLPSANLLLSILDKMGMPIEKIGNSSGELDVDTLSGV